MCGQLDALTDRRTGRPPRIATVREGKRRQIASLKENIKARLAATMDVAERQSLRHELELADLRLELIAAKEDPGDL
jgi:hypothetical protein